MNNFDMMNFLCIFNQNRILGDVSDQIGQIIGVVFENYKSLDESSPSGVADVYTPTTGSAAPALVPALKLYKLLNDILSSEAQLKLCRYFQVLTTIHPYLLYLHMAPLLSTFIFYSRLQQRRGPKGICQKLMR